MALAFAQMTFRESLRDIEACLSAQRSAAYHLGFRTKVTRSTLARANEERDWRLFAALAHKMIARARQLYADEPKVLDLEAAVYAVDSTLIELSLALCPWANWTGLDAAVKLHASLDLRGLLPAFAAITPGSYNDVLWLDELPIEAGSYYVMDRGYIDLRRLRRIAAAGAFFVIRDRPDIRWYVTASREVDRSTNLRCDQTIRFHGLHSARNWPDAMRRVRIFDAEHHRHLGFWTNQWTLPAATIAELYRLRWQIELFFRWVKHGLRIRTFYGTSANAVRVQLWTAICTYLAIAIARKELRIQTNMTTFVQVLSLHALSKTSVEELFADPALTSAGTDEANQLSFSNLC